MTVVIGTAGHIDHGKTTLLRALTGIDADRLPEERRRGMTIDVGYAHLAFDDGTELDFVDVPGHDRLVGNMLVGAGEMDAALLVVAADDGVRAQTREHLALLDALGVAPGIVVVTKIDAVEPGRVDEVVAEVERLLAGTSLAGSPVIPASSASSIGLEAVRDALRAVRDRVDGREASTPGRGSRLAVDRVFDVKGRGVVVTGSLRGGPLARGATLRVVPGEASVRIREIQVHGHAVGAAPAGRTALNVTGVGTERLHRGVVLAADPAVVGTSRLLVRLGRPMADRARARLHLGTVAVDAAIGRSGRDAIDLPDGTVGAILRLAEPVAGAYGDRFVLRRSGGADLIVGGLVLDPRPPRGVSRRRQTPARLGALAAAVAAGDPDVVAAARLDMHGLTVVDREVRLAADLEASAASAAADHVTGDVTLAALRPVVARAIRRSATSTRDEAGAAASAVIDGLVAAGTLVRDGDRLRPPGVVATGVDPATLAAMDRLEAALAVPAPPSLWVAARASECPPAGVRALEQAGRIAVVEPDLAYAMSTYRDLTARALAMSSLTPLTPAAFRDATGTSRRYVMAILEDLDRRGILRRTADGHVPGPKAPARTSAS